MLWTLGLSIIKEKAQGLMSDYQAVAHVLPFNCFCFCFPGCCCDQCNFLLWSRMHVFTVVEVSKASSSQFLAYLSLSVCVACTLIQETLTTEYQHFFRPPAWRRVGGSHKVIYYEACTYWKEHRIYSFFI